MPRCACGTRSPRHYQEFTGRRLDLYRLMAWHLRGALGDVLWRREADLHLAVRFGELGVDPSG